MSRSEISPSCTSLVVVPGGTGISATRWRWPASDFSVAAIRSLVSRGTLKVTRVPSFCSSPCTNRIVGGVPELSKKEMFDCAASLSPRYSSAIETSRGSP